MIVLRSLLFYLGLGLSVLIAVPIAFALLPVPFPVRFRLMSNWAPLQPVVVAGRLRDHGAVPGA